jgi:hypothetical protein
VTGELAPSGSGTAAAAASAAADYLHREGSQRKAAISATADATNSITRSIEEVTATDTIPIIAVTATNSSDTRSHGTAATTGAAVGALDRY